MTITIAVLEDEEIYCKQLLLVLQEWANMAGQNISCSCFYSGKSFFTSKNFNYDVIFLDIKLKDSDGIAIAKRLRRQHYKGGIIFLTSYREYVFEGYHVRALNYILKPVTLEKIKDSLNMLLQSLSSASYAYAIRGELTEIPYSKIIFFSSNAHYIDIVTHDRTYTQLESLNNIKVLLPAYFVQCHRSAIVNIMRAVTVKDYCVIFENGKQLTISRKHFRDVSNAFINYARGEAIL